MNIAAGALFGSITKRLAQGLIGETDERPDPHLDDGRRRYYRITAFGRRVELAETARLRELVDMATA